MGLKTGEVIREGDFIGLINLWAGSSAPTGWLLCDGAAVSRATYSKLFAIVGTSYGVGDGTTTFNLPNLKGRVPVGLDSTQTEFDALGETGGAKTHTLTVAEIPAHTHSMPTEGAGASAHNVPTVQSGGAAMQTGAGTGGGGAHNNIQPYIVLNYIIRAAQA